MGVVDGPELHVGMFVRKKDGEKDRNSNIFRRIFPDLAAVKPDARDSMGTIVKITRHISVYFS